MSEKILETKTGLSGNKVHLDYLLDMLNSLKMMAVDTGILVHDIMIKENFPEDRRLVAFLNGVDLLENYIDLELDGINEVLKK